MHHAPDNLLFFHSGSIGDFLMYLYLAEQFRQANPNVSVRIVMPRNAAFLRGFLKEYPYITIIEISKWKVWRLPQLFLRQRNLIAVIHPTIGHIPVRIKILGWLLTRRPGTVLIGFWDRGPLCSLYSKMLRYDPETPYHETLNHIAEALGVQRAGIPVLRFTPNPEVLAARGLRTDGHIVIHPGASTRARSFTAETIAALIQCINTHAPDLSIVLSGSETDRDLLAEASTHGRNVLCAVGASAEEIATIVGAARVYVGIDTGISHLACFLNVPAIVAAHEATQIVWLPWYAPTATVLYRLKEEDIVRGELNYVKAHRAARIQPFGRVPTDALVSAVQQRLQHTSTP